MAKHQRSSGKVIVSGNVIEVYDYEIPVLIGKKSGGRLKAEEGKSEREESNRRLSTRRARQNVRQLALSNFSKDDKFLTLTFREEVFITKGKGEKQIREPVDITNVKQCNLLFKAFMRKLKLKAEKQGVKLKYLAVIEFQDLNGRGAVHYHIMSNFKYIPQEELLKMWGHGGVFINRMDQKNDGKGVDNVGAYISAYMTEDVNDSRLKGEKAYLTSRSLDRPKTYKGAAGELIKQVYGLGNKKEVFTNQYSSEHNGKITYKEFNLDRE